jgi:hypothetical protein
VTHHRRTCVVADRDTDWPGPFDPLDVIILPFAALLYLSAYLDRGNLGNARLQGMF